MILFHKSNRIDFKISAAIKTRSDIATKSVIRSLVCNKNFDFAVLLNEIYQGYLRNMPNKNRIFLYISIVHGNNISNNSRHLILYLAVNEDERMTTFARMRYFDHLEYLLISS